MKHSTLKLVTVGAKRYYVGRGVLPSYGLWRDLDPGSSHRFPPLKQTNWEGVKGWREKMRQIIGVRIIKKNRKEMRYKEIL